jgi:hypothetical protein
LTKREKIPKYSAVVGGGGKEKIILYSKVMLFDLLTMPRDSRRARRGPEGRGNNSSIMTKSEGP